MKKQTQIVFNLSFILLFFHSTAQQNTTQLNTLKTYITQDINKADSIFNITKEYYLTPTNDSLYSQFYYLGGIINYYTNELLLSEQYYLKSLSTSYASRNPSVQSKIYNNLGVVYELSQRFDKALAAYQKSLAFEKEMGNKIGEMETELNIGLLAIKRKQYNVAETKLLESYYFFDSISNYSQKGLCLQNLGILYETLGKMELADSITQQAIINFRHSSNILGIAESFHNLANFKSITKDFKQAHQYLDSSIRYTDTNGYFFEVRLKLLEAKILVDEKRIKEGLEMLNTLAARFPHDLNINKLLEKIKSTAYATIGNIEGFNYSFAKFQNLGDSLDILNNEKELQQLETIYKTKEIEQELKLKETLLKQERKDKKNILVISIVLTALLSLLLLFKIRLTKIRSYLISNAFSRRLEEVDKERIIDPVNQDYLQLYQATVKKIKSEKLYLNPELKMENIAKELGTNNSKLSKCINEISGSNFSQLINNMRIRYSEELLMDEQYNVNEIAEMAGFANRVSFYRVFKLKTGLSPKEYKDAIPKKNKKGS